MNAMQAARLVREANATTADWDDVTRHRVEAACPPLVIDNGETLEDWSVAVAVLTLPGEGPVQAALRLAMYLALHAERYDHTPSLRRMDTEWSATVTPIHRNRSN